MGVDSMTITGKTANIAGPFRNRIKARKLERQVQDFLNGVWAAGGAGSDGVENFVYLGYTIPSWAHGVRVDPVGFFQWQLTATEGKGH